MRGVFITNATDDLGKAFIKRITQGGGAQDVYEVSMESAAALIDEERKLDESEFIDGGVDHGRLGRVYIAQVILGVDTKTLKRALNAQSPSPAKPFDSKSNEDKPCAIKNNVDNLCADKDIENNLCANKNSEDKLCSGTDNKGTFCTEAHSATPLATPDSPCALNNFAPLDSSSPVINSLKTHEQNMELLKARIETTAKSLDCLKEVALCGVQKVLDRGLKYMSTGEIKRVMLCAALLSKRKLLVLSDAWSGLDVKTKEIFGDYFNSWVAINSDVPFMGEEELKTFSATVKALADEVNSVMGLNFATLTSPDCPLIEMHGVKVGWDDRLVLRNLDWTVRQGEHTLVTGPNGSGKTTLLELITGDNMQVFCNDIKIFGRTRGPQLDKWTLKRSLGIVSYRLHVEYTLIGGISVEDVVVSGFHDSIGLYEAASGSERKAARQWLRLVKMEKKASANFATLSYGEQRMVLILRAAVKNPPLLILDEPCHALDPKSRNLVSKLLETIGKLGTSTLLHVTHEKDELLECEHNVLELCPESEPMYKKYKR